MVHDKVEEAKLCKRLYYPEFFPIFAADGNDFGHSGRPGRDTFHGVPGPFRQPPREGGDPAGRRADGRRDGVYITTHFN